MLKRELESPERDEIERKADEFIRQLTRDQRLANVCAGILAALGLFLTGFAIAAALARL